jgi:S-adenosylmethionine decarboxylase proenzyme
MRTEGRHLLLEYRGCHAGVLDDLVAITELMKAAARATGARIVGSIFEPFVPQGVTGVVVIEESHLSIHTWPEAGYAAADFFTCGQCKPEKAHEVLVKGLKAQRHTMMKIRRGIPEDPFLEVLPPD